MKGFAARSSTTRSGAFVESPAILFCHSTEVPGLKTRDLSRDWLCATAGPAGGLGVAEVISIGWLLEPAPLTGGLAGTAAIRRRAIKLAIGIVAARREENVAAAALALVVLGAHRAPSRKKIQAPLQSKTAPGRNKEGRRVFAVEEEENQPEENGFSNRHVSTTFIPPLTASEVVDICRVCGLKVVSGSDCLVRGYFSNIAR